jgi:transcriptional regulator with XRE-family HTH domain
MPDFERATVTTPYRGYGDDVRISGETLRQVRLLAGMSRETLARLSDTSYHTIIRAERGRDVGDGKRQAAIRRETLERIAQALGVVPALLIRRTERKAKGHGRNNADQGQTVRDGGAPGAAGARGVDPADGDRVDGDAVRDAG